VEKIRERVRHIAGAQITVAEQEEGPPTGAPINIEISGEDFVMLGKLAEQVRVAICQDAPSSKMCRTTMAGLPSVRVRIDRQKAALFELSSTAIGAASRPPTTVWMSPLP
jgi:multidrug efflux pump subunit AcrB